MAEMFLRQQQILVLAHSEVASLPCHPYFVLQVKQLPEEELLHQAAGAGVVAERMGLTPDWIISTGAFRIFQLQVRAMANLLLAMALSMLCCCV